ncbi:glycoside hydrolase family 3 C-terminal domain-containing protein [Devosia sp. ZB163]|uniref:beta-glucosidase family protein n=1 Tax=Devosia sp. ZB163 TaxID=3025938 RepID=UPI0023604502|nr:glycoside hydrolase family 3 C-terminal domain-containing protein [Devosia sp. ZB163]MDC9826489.1 glycoside hydrolase family 3 C-terminal domain-containing protein [Devosia sp. ZB163]
MTSRIEELVDQMTLAEQVSLLSGEDFWSLPAIARLGIGKLRVTDGPNGARGGGSLIGGVKSAAFPVGIALGASWNVRLLHEVGVALAEEVKSKGAHVSLAPTVNLHRTVSNGRNFECYSEDPFLTASLAVAYIEGLQSQRVSATIKHFVGNESEIERTTISSEVDERALRELYLMPFEWAVKKAGTWAIMSSYNKLNGTYTSENPWLLDDVLRREWHYDGVVMSDWFGSHSTAPTVNAGLDLEMPGPTRDRGDKLVAAVEAGEVSRDTVRTRALNILRLMERTGALDDHSAFEERADDRAEHRALIRRAGAEGAVLLKNEGSLLPLTGNGKVAVIGPNAKVAQIMGGGSAQLNPHYRISPWDGLVAALGEDRLSFAEGTRNNRFEPALEGGLEVEYFNNPDFSGTPVFTERLGGGEVMWFAPPGGVVDLTNFSARLRGTFTPTATGMHNIGVYAAGYARVLVEGVLVADASAGAWEPGRTYFEEGCDEVVGQVDLEAGREYEVVVEFVRKPPRILGFSALHVGIGRPLGDAEIAEAVAVAREAGTALVFVGRNGEWDTEGSDLASIILPGRQDELVRAVAAVNPRTVVVLQTGGPVEMPWIGEVAAVVEAWYPGQEAGNSIADVLTGAAEPGGRLPQTFPVKWADNPTNSQDREVYPGMDGKVRYEEGVFIGYRHYDSHGVAPLFPFGFGLGYTSFEISDISIDDSAFESDGRVAVSVTVANTGQRPGSEVVQVYVSDREASVPRPDKELKGFEKVFLGPGERMRITLELDARAFAFYRVEAKHWIVEPGTFVIRASRHAGDAGLVAEVSRQTRLMLPV